MQTWVIELLWLTVDIILSHILQGIICLGCSEVTFFQILTKAPVVEFNMDRTSIQNDLSRKAMTAYFW